MRLNITLTVIALFVATAGMGQAFDYVESAWMFSNTRAGGSARIQGVGGAQTSLGGDYSSAFSNPAGLGMFNRSEFTITPALAFFSTETDFLGNTTKENSSKFQIPGFSAVFHTNPRNTEGSFIGGAFAITFNRVNDFNNSFRFQGKNSESSIIESWIEEAFGRTTDQFAEGDSQNGIDPGIHFNSPVGLAYYNYLIGPASTLDETFPDDEYFTDVQSNFEEITSPASQVEVVETGGASNQWSLSYGANFNDKFFVGGGIGISTIRYESTQQFDESYEGDAYFSDLSLVERLESRGSGVNATLGAIFRPVPFVQLGFSYKTPTYYALSETYEASLSTNWKNFDYYGDGSEILTNESASTDVLNADYTLTVPGKLSFGATLISKLGFISADIEYTNPGNARYKSQLDGISFSAENQQIKRYLQSTLNYRLGAEARFNIFRVRGGVSLMGNPYKADVEQKMISFSGGAGVRLQSFYVDFALVHFKTNGQYSPYQFSNSGRVAPVVELNKRLTTGMITFGITF